MRYVIIFILACSDVEQDGEVAAAGMAVPNWLVDAGAGGGGGVGGAAAGGV